MADDVSSKAGTSEAERSSNEPEQERSFGELRHYVP
jgi:hypothetical protein